MSSPPFERFLDESSDPAVRGFLHLPGTHPEKGLVLTHGAGSNSQAPFLIALANAFAEAGFAVLRCDLPFRQQRSFGPPRPGDASRDRSGIQNAVQALQKEIAPMKITVGGHSYGGRQSSMLVADEPNLASGLLLSSYPLHPPSNPKRMRTEHLPRIEVPTLFVHGTRDPFATSEELEVARKLIEAKTLLIRVEGAGHDLGYGRKVTAAAKDLPDRVVRALMTMGA